MKVTVKFLQAVGRIPAPSDEFNIRFWHEHYQPDSKDLFSDATFCKIETNGYVIAIASARCSRKDRFVKSVGRRIALARAMAKGGFSMDECRQIYEQYLNTVKRQQASEEWRGFWSDYIIETMTWD